MSFKQRNRNFTDTQTHERGSTMVEFAIAVSFILVMLSSMGFYLMNYLSFSEENQVQQALKLGRLSAIPAVVVRDSNGSVIPVNDLGQRIELYLKGSFISREALSGKKTCQAAGDYRSFIIKFDLSKDGNSCDSNDPQGAACELFGGGIFDCTGKTVGDLQVVPERILRRVNSFVRGSPGEERTLVVVYSHTYPKLGAIIMDADALPSPQTTATPIPGPTP